MNKEILEGFCVEEVELFYLVEYRTDNHIEHKWLFRTKEQAKSHIKKELCGKYNKKTGYYDCQGSYYAQIITLCV